MARCGPLAAPAVPPTTPIPARRPHPAAYHAGPTGAATNAHTSMLHADHRERVRHMLTEACTDMLAIAPEGAGAPRHRTVRPVRATEGAHAPARGLRGHLRQQPAAGGSVALASMRRYAASTALSPLRSPPPPPLLREASYSTAAVDSKVSHTLMASDSPFEMSVAYDMQRSTVEQVSDGFVTVAKGARAAAAGLEHGTGQGYPRGLGSASGRQSDIPSCPRSGGLVDHRKC